MYLKKLHISNFRCFHDYEIEFAPGVTVLFGKNGSGKSTLIHAIHKAMSFIFKNDVKSNDALNLSAGFDSLKVRNYSRKDDVVRNEETGMAFPFINIHAEADMLGSDLAWDLYASTSTCKVQPSRFMEAYSTFIEKVRDTDEWPVLSYFSDSFPHVSTKAARLTKTQLSLRNLGYLGWDEETAYSDLWITRLTKTLMQRSLSAYSKDAKLFDKELNEITDCLVRFSQGDPNFEVKGVFVSPYEEDGLCLETTDGVNPSFEKLPAGYKRLLYMVLDIAYRSFLLSGGRSTDIPGLVIIDEIDLHLHPELEQAVLGRFMRTFPSVQFIVSTHSPLVLTGVETESKKNCIWKLTSGGDVPEKLANNIYGIDYNQALEENMGVTKRLPEIQTLFDKAWSAVAEKDVDKAKTAVKQLEQQTAPDQIELVKLRALISRIEIIGR